MAIAKLDLTGETAESLERGSPEARSAFFKHYVRTLSVGVAGFLGCVVALGVVIAYWSALWRWFNTASFGGLLFILLLVCVSGAAFAALMTSMYACVQLGHGPPKAPGTPEEAISLFIIHCLPFEHMSVMRLSAHSEGYLLLVDGAKREARSFANFQAYWTGVRTRLLEEARERLTVKDVQLIRCWPKEVKPAGEEQGMLVYEAYVLVRGYVVKSRANAIEEEPVGMVCFRDRFSVAEVDGRWYLTSPYWSGELVESDAVWPFPM
jgi:hypothetical protein